MTSTTQRSVFRVGEQQLCGYWHLPGEGAGPWPLVLFGHGFAAEWHFGTRPWIDAFLAAGCAVFTFDYRHFGESEGEPRQLISVSKQLADWRAALAHVRQDSRIDTSRIALWGSSFGGGHALNIAAGDHELAAVVAQVPHCDSRGVFKRTPLRSLPSIVAHSLFDLLCGLLGKTHRIPVVAEPGETGALSYPGWKQGYLRLVSVGSDWKNAIPARSLLAVSSYNPIDVVDRITCPVLIVYGRQDEGIPEETVLATAERIDNCEVEAYDGGHFDVYSGPIHQRCLARQLEFIRRQLRP